MSILTADYSYYQQASLLQLGGEKKLLAERKSKQEKTQRGRKKNERTNKFFT